LMNEVNAGMAASLADAECRSRFMLMNNGVTIIAKRVVSAGDDLTLDDYQIVNGCQTSHVLWESRAVLSNANLSVPVKVVATSDEVVVSDIIRATNSQTNVSRVQLQAATVFQKSLEECFNAYESPGLRYERRSKQYAGVSLARSKIVTQFALVKAFASVFQQAPHQLTKGFKLVLHRVGDSIFNANHRPEIYVYAATLCYAIEQLLRKRKIDRGLSIARFHIAMVYHQLQRGVPTGNADSVALQKYCASKIESFSNLDDFATAVQPAVDIVAGALEEKSRNGVRQVPFTTHLLTLARSIRQRVPE
jgi:AIPR protein